MTKKSFYVLKTQLKKYVSEMKSKSSYRKRRFVFISRRVTLKAVLQVRLGNCTRLVYVNVPNVTHSNNSQDGSLITKKVYPQYELT